jgi:RNA polymerase sigma-70 factor (ECF subfamily)
VGLALRAAEGRLQDDAVPSPEGAVLAQDERRRLVAAMNQLRPEDRLVLAYRYWFELSEEEMADALGCARGTVKSRLFRALGRLRDVMGPAGFGEERMGLEGVNDG